MNKPPDATSFVGRGGLKLQHALEEFAFSTRGLGAADFGANVGGFTDCLLQNGAAHVYAIDTGYGTLDYRLRVDERVTVMERTNCLHADLPDGVDGVDLVVIDAGWTPQERVIPAALRWLRSKETGRIITLIKPHYESKSKEHVLDDADAERIAREVADRFSEFGAEILGFTTSPIRGGGSKRRKHGGNLEFLAFAKPVQQSARSE